MEVTSGVTSRMIPRAFSAILLVVGIVSAIPGSADAAVPVELHTRAITVVTDTSITRSARMLETPTEPFSVEVDHLPPATTAVSLQRVRYEPGVELALQPIDGPRLLLIESGVLSLELARSGAMRVSPGTPEHELAPLAGGTEHQIAAGEVVLIPAGVPLQLANRATAPVAWLQFQAETPPTICACGEDLTGSETTLLASQTLEQPIAVPTAISIATGELAPQEHAPIPAAGTVQLVAPVAPEASLATGSDGHRRNDSTASIAVFIVTVGASPATT